MGFPDCENITILGDGSVQRCGQCALCLKRQIAALEAELRAAGRALEVARCELATYGYEQKSSTTLQQITSALIQPYLERLMEEAGR